MANIFGRHLSTVTYLLICSIISTPFNYANFELLFTEDGIPSGADSAFHSYSILKILRTGDPLIPYTAFPTVITNTSGYYPSLMHLTISSIARIASFDQALIYDPSFVIEVGKLFMLTVSFVGTVGFALLIRTILDKLITDKIGRSLHSFDNLSLSIIYLTISVLAFGVFIYSISPIVRTYNDGTYGELFAMWSVFPYYLYHLVNKRWIISAILLAIIASTHNLAFLMSLSATVPFIVSLLIARTRRLKINLLKFIVIFLVFAVPAIIFFYFPIASVVMQGRSAESVYVTLPNENVVNQLKPGLYYGGIICTAMALLLNRRILGWISGWALIYFMVFNLSSVLGDRFARELSIIFGLLIGICVAYVLLMSLLTRKMWLKKGKIELNNILLSSEKVILIISISAIIISVQYLYFQDRFHNLSNPITTKYFTEAVDESNRFFLTLMNEKGNSSFANEKRVIVLFGDNPWLKVTTYGNFEVIEAEPGDTRYMGRGTKPINDELNQIITSPDARSAACIIKKYQIDYIYISDRIPSRWYSPYKGSAYYDQLSLFQSFAQSPLFDLKTEFFGKEGEHLRIFSVNGENVNQTCNPS